MKQRHDHDESHSPIVHADSIRMTLALAAACSLKITGGDIGNCFQQMPNSQGATAV